MPLIYLFFCAAAHLVFVCAVTYIRAVCFCQLILFPLMVPCDTSVVKMSSPVGMEDPEVQIRWKELKLEMRRLAIT